MEFLNWLKCMFVTEKKKSLADLLLSIEELEDQIEKTIEVIQDISTNLNNQQKDLMSETRLLLNNLKEDISNTSFKMKEIIESSSDAFSDHYSVEKDFIICDKTEKDKDENSERAASKSEILKVNELNNPNGDGEAISSNLKSSEKTADNSKQSGKIGDNSNLSKVKPKPLSLFYMMNKRGMELFENHPMFNYLPPKSN